MDTKEPPPVACTSLMMVPNLVAWAALETMSLAGRAGLLQRAVDRRGVGQRLGGRGHVLLGQRVEGLAFGVIDEAFRLSLLDVAEFLLGVCRSLFGLERVRHWNFGPGTGNDWFTWACASPVMMFTNTTPRS